MKIIEFENGSEIHCVKGIKKSQRGDRANYIIDWTRNDFTIGEVLDRNTQSRSDKWGYRVGRKCFIHNCDIQVGKPLKVQYDDGRYFTTSPVVEINQDCGGVWIITQNTEYRFDN